VHAGDAAVPLMGSPLTSSRPVAGMKAPAGAPASSRLAAGEPH
jgi:hypothetical protein